MTSRREEVAVVVPIYKSALTRDEAISLRHLRQYLGPYPKFFLAPTSLDLGSPDFHVKRFPDECFTNVRTYSALLLSDRFYRSFENYRYILIYQLDALVFSDQLLDWCARGYDYIGAPWIVPPAEGFVATPCVGNGGLSLRRIEAFLRVLNSKVYFQQPKEYWADLTKGKSVIQKARHLPRGLLKTLRKNNGARWEAARWPRDGFSIYGPNEDLFWSLRAEHYDPEFKIAGVSDALKFAFELEPQKCYELNNHELPFGCHGWAKYDREFWEPFLLG